MLFTAVSALCALSIPLFVRYVTKELIADGLTWSLVSIGMVMALVTTVQVLSYYVLDYHGHRMGAMMERDMRQELFEHFMKLPVAHYDREPIGGMMSRITNDLLMVSELAHHGPEDYLRHGIKFGGALAILAWIDWRLTLVIAVFLPIMGGLILYFN